MTQTERAVASRCLDDSEYTRQVVRTGEFPAVRDAIVHDWEEGAEVHGFFNPQPDPPAEPALVTLPPEEFDKAWRAVPKPRLSALAGRS